MGKLADRTPRTNATTEAAIEAIADFFEAQMHGKFTNGEMLMILADSFICSVLAITPDNTEFLILRAVVEHINSKGFDLIASKIEVAKAQP